MLHFVTSYMNQNKSRKQTLESAQYGLEISFKSSLRSKRFRGVGEQRKTKERYFARAKLGRESK